MSSAVDAREVAVGAPDLVRAQVGPRDRWAPPHTAACASTWCPTASACASRWPPATASAGWRCAGPPPHRPGSACSATRGSAPTASWAGPRSCRTAPCRGTVLLHEAARGTTRALGTEVRGAALACWTADPDGVTLWLDLRSGGEPVRSGRPRPDGGGGPRGRRGRPAGGAAHPGAPPVPRPAGACHPAGGGQQLVLRLRPRVRPGRRRPRRAHRLRPGRRPPRAALRGGRRRVVGRRRGRRPRGLRRPLGPGPPADVPRHGRGRRGHQAQGARPGLWYRPLLRREPSQGALAGALVGSGRGRRQDGWALDPSHRRCSTSSARTSAASGAGASSCSSTTSPPTTSSAGGDRRWAPAPPRTGGPSPTRRSPPPRRWWAFYRAVREAAADVVVLGCNTVGHLAAGLVEAQRTGDDTSGLRGGTAPAGWASTPSRSGARSTAPSSPWTPTACPARRRRRGR